MAILATMEGDRDAEREIHGRFAHVRLGRKEQFRPVPELMAFIGRPLLVGANPDAVEAMAPAPVPAGRWADVVAKIGEEAVRLGKIAALFKDMTLADYVTHVLIEAARRDIDAEHAKMKRMEGTDR